MVGIRIGRIQRNETKDATVKLSKKYGYTIDIQMDKQIVDAQCQERRCACVGSYRYVKEGGGSDYQRTIVKNTFINAYN